MTINEFLCSHTVALEWTDFDNLERIVIVVFEPLEGHLNVYNTERVLLRFADLKYQRISKSGREKSSIELHTSSDKQENLVAVKLLEYDLVSNVLCNFENLSNSF